MAAAKKKYWPGISCAVVGCANNYGKLHKWRDAECDVHVGLIHMDCPCLVPYALHVFPREPKSRQEWIRALHRAKFSPNANSRVCSVHFLDGKPTALNPNPELNLGYSKKVVKGCQDAIPNLDPTFLVACEYSEPNRSELLDLTTLSQVNETQLCSLLRRKPDSGDSETRCQIKLESKSKRVGLHVNIPEHFSYATHYDCTCTRSLKPPSC